MKRLFLTMVGAWLLVPVQAEAQGGNGRLTADATVAKFAQVTTLGQLAFSSLSRTGNNSTSADVRFDFNYAAATVVEVPARFTYGSDPSITIPVSVTCSFAGSPGGLESAAPGSCPASPRAIGVANVVGASYLRVSATITSAAVTQVPAGEYSGSVTITITNRDS